MIQKHQEVPQNRLVERNVVPGSIKMFIQEHFALGEIRFCKGAHLFSMKTTSTWKVVQNTN